MRVSVLLITVGALVTSVALTRMVIRFALSHGVLDVPNARSSHESPTPRGGGLAIVLSTTLGLFALAWMSEIQSDMLITLAVGGMAVGAVGLIDDRYHLSAVVRLTIHFIAAAWALIWLGGLPTLSIGEYVVTFGWIGYLLGSLGIVWTVNLFNFMDGLDGIAASECLFIATAAAVLTVFSGASNSSPAMLVFAASCCGFLFWNWPPAKVFMGDVGSGYTGYVVAVLALASAREGSVALSVWLILGGVFFVDATVTLLGRLLRSEKIHEAHRSHAYQWLARRWGSHKRVTATVIVVNIAWLFPCALMATMYPRAAGWIVPVALIPIVIAALAVGAGRPEMKPGKSQQRS